MRILFCCEFYYPSIGGVQEVMRHLAERLVSWGHEVTVATTKLSNRTFTEHNGVKIVEFGVTGNQVRGISGEVARYQDFVINFPCDALMIKAAQQWTFDALWPVLEQIKTRKVFIPCGFSGLYEPSYAQYFIDLPEVLKKFDHLIFYAEHYRDVDFARAHKLMHFSVLANGACEKEFNVAVDASFRRRNAIAENSFVLLTVGSLTGVKGHRELAEAFAKMNVPKGHHVTLILNGNLPPRPDVKVEARRSHGVSPRDQVSRGSKLISYVTAKINRITGLLYRSVGVLRREGVSGVGQRIASLLLAPLWRLALAHGFLKKASRSMEYWIDTARRNPSKQVLLTDFARDELVQAYMAADLFVFASNIEYSPLVLFEAAAAGTPFLSVPVGNADEIARWTGGGVICPASKDERGYTRVDPLVLSGAVEDLMAKPEELSKLGKTAKQTWSEKYTWFAIAKRYEQILANKLG